MVAVGVLVIVAVVVLVVIAISREVWREVKWVPSGLNCCEKWPQSIRKKKVVFQFSFEVETKEASPSTRILLQALIPA